MINYRIVIIAALIVQIVNSVRSMQLKRDANTRRGIGIFLHAYLKRRFFATVLMSGAIIAIAFAAIVQSESPNTIIAETDTPPPKIIICIDVSLSMSATDVLPTRLSRAQQTALEIIRIAENADIALLVFADEAFFFVPFTTDSAFLIERVGQLAVTLFSSGGSDLSSAFTIVLNLIKDESERYQPSHRYALFVLSDGEFHQPLGQTLIDGMQSTATPITFYGIGTTDGTLLYDEQQNSLLDGVGNEIRSALDERQLRALARMTNGEYIHVTDLRSVTDSSNVQTLFEQEAPPPSRRMARRLFSMLLLGLAMGLLYYARHPLRPKRREAP